MASQIHTSHSEKRIRRVTAVLTVHTLVTVQNHFKTSATKYFRERLYLTINQFLAGQVEGTKTRIVSRRVSKIPPIYERPTASNISFEKGGEYSVSKPCNHRPPPSSASRGVKLQPLEEKPSKIDTVPLLTPTMESDLLKEPWIFPHAKTNTIKEEEKSASFTWEEDFQDLSGWCMDTFQGQCNFHIGESPTFKLSGTKYEGTSALSSDEGGLIDMARVEVDEKWSVKVNTAESTKHLNNNCRNSLQSTPRVISKYQREDTASQSSATNSWSKLSKGETLAVNTPLWSKQNDTVVNATPQMRYQVEDIDLDDACPTSVETTESEHDSWDILCTVTSDGSNTFDLLSYLCDDEMRSPEDSVSTDSSVQSKPWSPVKLQATTSSASTETKPKVRPATRKRAHTRATSTSTSTETPSVSSQKSEQVKKFVNNKIQKASYNKVAKRGRPGRKRYVDSNSDDLTYVGHYRESREKNNEASRKSRMNKKAKESEMTVKAIELEKDNRILKMKVEELEKLVTSMRSALLRSALKKEI